MVVHLTNPHISFTFLALFSLYLLLYHSTQLEPPESFDFRISLNFKMRLYPDMSWLSYY